MSGFADTTMNLVRFSAGGVSYAMDAVQAETISPYNAEESDNLFWLHEELGYTLPNVQYTHPSVISIKTENGSPYRIVIDSLEDIAEFSASHVSLIPPLLESFLLKKGIWGILLYDERPILLIDFQLFLREKHKHIVRI